MRYFIHVNAGTVRALDKVGNEYTDLASARAEAAEAAREIVSLKLHHSEVISRDWSSEIADPHRNVVERLSLEHIMFGASLPDRQRHPRGEERRFQLLPSKWLSPRPPSIPTALRAGCSMVRSFAIFARSLSYAWPQVTSGIR